MKRWLQRTWRLLWSERPQLGQVWQLDGLGLVFVTSVTDAPAHEMWGWGDVEFRCQDKMVITWDQREFRREATPPRLLDVTHEQGQRPWP